MKKEIDITLSSQIHQKVKTRYLIGADGSRSRIRKKMRPNDFGKASGGTINYYVVGDAVIDPNTLYMVFNREFCPLMFAWIYMKDDKYVIGTGANENPRQYAEKFFDYVKNKYNLSGDIVKREGFSSTLQEGVYLGEKNMLMIVRLYPKTDLSKVWNYVENEIKNDPKKPITPLYATQSEGMMNVGIIFDVEHSDDIAPFITEEIIKCNEVHHTKTISLMKPVFFPIPKRKPENVQRYIIRIFAHPRHYKNVYNHSYQIVFLLLLQGFHHY